MKRTNYTGVAVLQIFTFQLASFYSIEFKQVFYAPISQTEFTVHIMYANQTFGLKIPVDLHKETAPSCECHCRLKIRIMI